MGCTLCTLSSVPLPVHYVAPAAERQALEHGEEGKGHVVKPGHIDVGAFLELLCACGEEGWGVATMMVMCLSQPGCLNNQIW